MQCNQIPTDAPNDAPTENPDLCIPRCAESKVHTEDGIEFLQMENQLAVPGDGQRYRTQIPVHEVLRIAMDDMTLFTDENRLHEM